VPGLMEWLLYVALVLDLCNWVQVTFAAAMSHVLSRVIGPLHWCYSPVERGKQETKRRAEKLKGILGFQQPLQVSECSTYPG
jgi:hypothetical protein